MDQEAMEKYQNHYEKVRKKEAEARKTRAAAGRVSKGAAMRVAVKG